MSEHMSLWGDISLSRHNRCEELLRAVESEDGGGERHAQALPAPHGQHLGGYRGPLSRTAPSRAPSL